MSFPEGWPAGRLEKPIKAVQSARSMSPMLKITIWIKVGDTEIRREFSHMIDVDHYLEIFERDWLTLESRANKLPKDRMPGDSVWFDITAWFERPGVELQDNTETIDLETGRAFVRMVFEAWSEVDGS